MKFVVFNNEREVGLIDGQRIMHVARAVEAYGQSTGKDFTPDHDSFSSLQSFIECGQRGLELVQEALETCRHSEDPKIFTDLDHAQLHATWPGQRLVMAGINFADHVSNFFTHFGAPMSLKEAVAKVRSGSPQGFWAVSRPIMGPGNDIEIPARANGLFDYEAEPGLILGKRGKDIKSKEFKDYVWGVTLLVDWSVRSESWPPKTPDPFLFAKNFDCSKSIGPCIVVGEIDPNDVSIQTLVNGSIKQEFSSRDMIFSFDEIVEYLSQDFTFFPGDVVSGGTAGGTAIDQVVPRADGTLPRDLFLKEGDVVEVRSPSVGSLKSNIVAKRGADRD